MKTMIESDACVINDSVSTEIIIAEISVNLSHIDSCG